MKAIPDAQLIADAPRLITDYRANSARGKAEAEKFHDLLDATHDPSEKAVLEKAYDKFEDEDNERVEELWDRMAEITERPARSLGGVGVKVRVYWSFRLNHFATGDAVGDVVAAILTDIERLAGGAA